MHLLIEARPCYKCGRPAVRAYGANNTPICTLCRAGFLRERGAQVRENAPPFRDKGEQDIDSWEPERYANL